VCIGRAQPSPPRLRWCAAQAIQDLLCCRWAVRFIGSTAIVLTTLQLGSVVDGNEVSNPFVVTEVYVRQADAWTLASMSFTRLVTHQLDRQDTKV
jgi:hypothetical protein